MRAVNLIPPDLRRASGTAGATGPAAYVLLAVLGVAVVLVAAWGLAARTVAQGEADLVKVGAEANAAEVRAGQLKPYAQFSAMRAKRVETVTSLSRSRFNWPFALREVSRVLPDDVWLSLVVGTVAPGIQLEDAGGGATTPLRNALAAPAIEVVGCTTNQEQVARFLARLRSIQGVTRVTLATTEKVDVDAKSAGSGGGAGASGGNATDCRQGNSKIPKFELVIFFEASTATPAQATQGSPAPATTQPASTTSTTPKEGSK
jgi:Tfp pilus assembly protein PilN